MIEANEAHCFSSWGQDFRVDYLYIGDFIKSLQEKKNIEEGIPVSCFTSTAKQKVIEDIRDYFQEKLALDLEVYSSSASRSNLRYKVVEKESEEEKYNTVRDLIEEKKCPTIAKRNMSIHYNADYLHFIKTEGLKIVNDPENYSPPCQLAMQLTYKDVGLDFFSSCQHFVSELNSGDELTIDRDCCRNSKPLPYRNFPHDNIHYGYRSRYSHESSLYICSYYSCCQTKNYCWHSQR